MTSTQQQLSCDTFSGHESSGKTITDILEKTEVRNIAQIKKETNQDKKGPLPWNDYFESPRMRTRHKDKKKN